MFLNHSTISWIAISKARSGLESNSKSLPSAAGPWKQEAREKGAAKAAPLFRLFYHQVDQLPGHVDLLDYASGDAALQCLLGL